MSWVVMAHGLQRWLSTNPTITIKHIAEVKPLTLGALSLAPGGIEQLVSSYAS